MSDQETLKTMLRAGQPVVIEGILYNMTPEVCVWVNERLGGGLVPKIAHGLGILRSGVTEAPTTDQVQDVLAGGAYFFDHEADNDVSDVTVAVALDDIAYSTPNMIRQIVAYPFGQLKVRRVSAEIDLSNDRAVRQAEAIGFVLEGRKRRKGAGGGDVGLFGLLPDECPFWKNEAT